MHKSLYLISVLRLNRYNISAVTHSNYVFLQILKSCAGGIALEGVLDFVVCLTNFATNFRKCGTRLVGNHILCENRASNFFHKRSVGEQSGENLVKRALKGLVSIKIVEHGSGGAHQRCDFQKLAR